jgi:hypothetical protein
MKFPENFGSLHGHEEGLRRASIKAIEKSDVLSAHAEFIECAMNALNHFTYGYETKDQDKRIVQLLGIRMFNATGASLKLLLSGYYQNAATLMRDVLETTGLVDYFGLDPTRIARWRTLDDRARWKEFQSVVVRRELAKGDNEKMRAQRNETYKILSTYASHPSPQGFRMIRKSPAGLHEFGPFFDGEALSALVAETAKIMLPASTHFCIHFKLRALVDHMTAIGFMEIRDKWEAKFFGEPFEPAKYAELRRRANISFASAAAAPK